MSAISVVATGDVQGVGFRDFVRKTARELDVKGEVWNRVDHAVELIATHPDSSILETFVEQLHQGPGRVDHLKTEYLAAHYTYEDFVISAGR